MIRCCRLRTPKAEPRGAGLSVETQPGTPGSRLGWRSVIAVLMMRLLLRGESDEVIIG